MKILVIACSSASIRFTLFDMQGEQRLASGLIERLGERRSRAAIDVRGTVLDRHEPIPGHSQGLHMALTLLTSVGHPPALRDTQEIDAVGHHVPHGGEEFCESVLVDEQVLAAIDRCCELAPLHNPASLAGIRAARAALPDRPHVAVFDTAFFQTLPPAAYLYAVPYEWYTAHKVRRFGFHGTSHRFVAGRAAELLGKPTPNLITLHLDNACSAACIRAGVAIDQSAGMTPLEGLSAGTRCGDIDPAIIFHVARRGLTCEQIRHALERQSGLLGLSGVSCDLRDVAQAAEQGSVRARLAIEVFAHRVRKYVGAFLAELSHCDAIIFTGTIGQNSTQVRRMVLEGLAPLGVSLDPQRNERRSPDPFCITRPLSRIAAWVIPTDEELMIARDTARFAAPEMPDTAIPAGSPVPCTRRP